MEDHPTEVAQNAVEDAQRSLEAAADLIATALKDDLQETNLTADGEVLAKVIIRDSTDGHPVAVYEFKLPLSIYAERGPADILEGTGT